MPSENVRDDRVPGTCSCNGSAQRQRAKGTAACSRSPRPETRVPASGSTKMSLFQSIFLGHQVCWARVCLHYLTGQDVSFVSARSRTVKNIPVYSKYMQSVTSIKHRQKSGNNNQFIVCMSQSACEWQYDRIRSLIASHHPACL